MKKKTLKLITIFGLTVLTLTVLGSCATTKSAKTNDSFFNKANDYDFKLVEPKDGKFNIGLKEVGEVKLAFNEEKFKSLDAYIGIVTDNGLNEIYVDRSPTVDLITASGYFDGEYTRDYLLMPGDKEDPKEALAGVRVHFTVSGVVSKTEQESIKLAVEKLTKVLQNKDLKAFQSLYLQKETADNLIKQLDPNANTDKEAVEGLTIVSSDKQHKKLDKYFKAFQEELTKQDKKAASLKFVKYGRKDLLELFSVGKVVGVQLVFDCNGLELAPSVMLLLSKDKAYLLSFR